MNGAGAERPPPGGQPGRKGAAQDAPRVPFARRR